MMNVKSMLNSHCDSPVTVSTSTVPTMLPEVVDVVAARRPKSVYESLNEKDERLGFCDSLGRLLTPQSSGCNLAALNHQEIEKKMTRRIAKDIKKGRLTRSHSSDSFLEGQVELSRRKMRSYLSFGHGSGTELDTLAQSRWTSMKSFGAKSRGYQKVGVNANFQQLTRLSLTEDKQQRKASATSVGRALLSR